MMNSWYTLLSFLPFEWAAREGPMFMKHALLAIILLSPILGILSTMIVNNHMAFFSDALGHGAFTGIVIGAFMGFFSPLGSAIFFSIFFSILMTLVRHQTKMAADTVIGVFASFAMAVGIFLSTEGGKSFSKLNRYLIGDILSITKADIRILALSSLLMVVIWVFLLNRLLIISINQSYAKSLGLPTLAIELVFTVIVAVMVTLSIQWFGLLVINSLLVLPGATARNIARNIRTYHVLAVSCSLVSSVSGLILSYYGSTASGATIVLLSVGFFLITFLLKIRTRH